MRWYILAYVLTGLNIFSSLFQLIQNREGWYTALGSAIFWGIIGYILQGNYQKKHTAQTHQVVQPTEPTVQRKIPLKDLYAERYVCKVAGVTYRNDDGEQRQAILKKIYYEENGSIICILDKYTYEGSPAFYVLSPHGAVGNVPSNCVANVIDALTNDNVSYINVNEFEDDDGNTKYWAELTIYYGTKQI